MTACFIGYVVQAIVCCFAPLLFLTFQNEYGIPIEKITLLITLNFTMQLIIDFSSAFITDKIGYRACAVAAHLLSAAGLVLMAILPDAFGDPFAGLAVAVFVYAVGGGLIEVMISPIVQSCPTDGKATAMSLAHSFFCWGEVAVILLSTLYFTVFGIASWRILSVLWAILPLLNAVFFAFVPIKPLLDDGKNGFSVGKLLRSKTFVLMAIIILCGGSAEQAVSQWASAFAEKGLGMSKTVGDLVGPLVFAALMGASRLMYSKIGHRLNINNFMTFCGGLCLASYLLISLSASPVLGFIGCGICGFSVGIFWPGAYSIAAEKIPGGGTAMFSLLALFGDLGCTIGPTAVGIISGTGDNMKLGILAGAAFPAVLTVCMLIARRRERDVS